ncbi:hypothetical protein GW17_00049459, partial [Ensete ventricosum]
APDGRVLIAGGKRTSWWGHAPCRLARRSGRYGWVCLRCRLVGSRNMSDRTHNHTHLVGTGGAI